MGLVGGKEEEDRTGGAPKQHTTEKTKFLI